jgi:hypothetical protein
MCFMFTIALFSNLWGVVSGDMGGSVKEGMLELEWEARRVCRGHP